MVEQISHRRPYNPDIDAYDENTASQRAVPYRFAQSARTDSYPEDSVPLFLSDYDGEPDPSEFITPPRRERTYISSRILAGVSAAAAVAILFALFSSDASRDIIVNAKASIATVLPAPSEAAQPASTQLTARDIQLKDPTRLSAPANQTPGVRTVATVAVAPTRAEMPSRAEITTAYQSALQSRAPAAAEPVAAPPARKLAADELATLMNRARALLAAGDIPPARLLLERAADAQEASAALLLGQTYDPAVLGTPDMRSITPDPATARGWYQKAARYGSQEAQLRLAQMQN
jgi:TPR repeat protein